MTSSRLVGLILSLSLACSSSFAGGPFPTQGKIVEIASGKPIGNAWVAQHWSTKSIVTARSSCSHVQIASTNSNGEYAIPV